MSYCEDCEPDTLCDCDICLCDVHRIKEDNND